ncbi:hypothetical protein ACXPWS_26950 [Mycobacterium sp. BMJ-28]
MAIQAGRAAVTASGVDPGDIRWALHAGSGYQGPMGWPVHHHIKLGVVGHAGNALELKQYCAAGLTSWLVAAGLQAGSDAGAIVCTGADNWSWGDRFAVLRAVGGEPHSDVAHAAVLTTDHGFADILGTGTASHPETVDLWKTRDRFSDHASMDDYQASYRRAVAAADVDTAGNWVRVLATATRTALTGAGVSPQYVTHFVPHGSGSGEPYRTLAKKMALPWSESLHEHQMGLGYLGVSSHAAGLIWCCETGLVADSIVLLLAAEYQLSATAVVLRIRRTPGVKAEGDLKVVA